MGQDRAVAGASSSPMIADAAEASSVETAVAIDRAAAINDDPQVAEALDQAALAADQTVSRVGWLRGFLHRCFARWA